MYGQLRFIPFLHNPEEIIFLFLIFNRISGIFIISPLLSNDNIPTSVRSYLSIFMGILIAISLHPYYFGTSAGLSFINTELDGFNFLIQLIFFSIKELATGYLIGLFFSLVLEAILFASQTTGVMVGFSMARLIDPISGSDQTVLGQLYMIFAMLIVLVLDLHHLSIQVLYTSFSLVPLGSFEQSPESMHHVIHGTSRMWHYVLQFAAVPYVILFFITVGLGFMAKIMPEMNIFMVGFPLKIFVGYYTLILAMGFFPYLIQSGYLEYTNLSKNVLSLIGQRIQ